MKTFCIGDIHGAYHALLQCLERSRFDRKNDRLICLGDVCDRGVQVRECMDVLLGIPHCIYILGNHDVWALEWAREGKKPREWWDQGGARTYASYGGAGMPEDHVRFLSKGLFYYVDRNRLFVHGGFDPQSPLEETSREIFIWDRSLLEKARLTHSGSPGYKFGEFDEIFVGHTPTLNFGRTTPSQFCNIWALDTGAGWGGRLSIMDADTKEYWQSDPVEAF
ncbi:MAG: serine/threonine protein phosphatase [Candidatus Omnitrophica bacterium]|nr:serine/threonine protein phosphatase [Candidatus Omnitrophota bacterium]